MKKSTKMIVKSTLGATAVFLGVCGGIYECVLGRKAIDLNKKYQIFSDSDNKGFYSGNPEKIKGDAWYKTVKPKPISTMGDDGNIIYAYVAKQKVYSTKWAICIHGYTDSPLGMANIGRYYYEKGYNVLLPCLKAHSLDTSNYCSMGYYDRYMICRWVNYITQKDSMAQIVLHGVSMGSATTMLATGERLPENVKCAVCDCGYTSTWDQYSIQIVSMLHLPVYPFLPVINKISVLRGNLDMKKCAPIKAIAHSKTPTLFIHGEKDRFVPYEMMGKLYDACSAEKDKLTVPEAFHATSSYVNPELYWSKVQQFTEKYIN